MEGALIECSLDETGLLRYPANTRVLVPCELPTLEVRKEPSAPVVAVVDQRVIGHNCPFSRGDRKGVRIFIGLGRFYEFGG